MFHQGFKQQTRDEISVSWLDDHVMNNLWVRETQLIYVYSFCRSSCDLDFPDKILQGALGAKLFCDNSRPLRDDDFTINPTLGEKFIIGIFYTICRANSNKPSSSLVSTSSLSIYDKTVAKERWFILKIVFFLDVGVDVLWTRPAGRFDTFPTICWHRAFQLTNSKWTSVTVYFMVQQYV